MKKYFAGISILMVIVLIQHSCQLRNRPIAEQLPLPNYRYLIIDSLFGLNLSEDATLFSSQQDELFLWRQVFRQQQGRLEPLDWGPKLYAPIIMNDSTRKKAIGDTLDMQEWTARDSVLLVFSLLELDEDTLSLDKIAILQEEIGRGHFLNTNAKFQLDTLAGNDDYLGYKYFYWDNASTRPLIRLRFKGIQLFDRYDYRLKCRLY